jgi:hypothetical protein
VLLTMQASKKGTVLRMMSRNARSISHHASCGVRAQVAHDRPA